MTTVVADYALRTVGLGKRCRRTWALRACTLALLFAFAAGAAAGALLRRSIPALTVSLLAFVAARATVEGVLRPHYRRPFTLIDDIGAGGHGIAIGTGDRTDWILDQGFADATGQRLTHTDMNSLDDAARNAGVNLATYAHNHGIQRWVDYHPASRFWEFQYIESGIYAGLAAILLAVVIWRVKRRAM